MTGGVIGPNQICVKSAYMHIYGSTHYTDGHILTDRLSQKGFKRFAFSGKCFEKKPHNFITKYSWALYYRTHQF